MFGQVRRHPYLALSLVAHAALLGVLYVLGVRVELDRQRIQRAREQPLVDAGKRLTERARLEQRVHDMARIESLLEKGAAAHDEDDVQFSAQPRTPDELLKEASELSRRIDDVERDARAEQLAKLLRIPKQQALEKMAQARKPAQLSGAETGKPVDAAAKIEQLEARARRALEWRRQQLEQQNGMRVTASESREVGNAHASSELQRISAFTKRSLPEQATQAYRGPGEHDFLGHGAGRIPAVDAGPVVKGTGRIIGPGGPYANRVYVNRWYLIGPFEGRHGGGVFSNTINPPEQAVVLDAAYRGKGGRLLRWEYVDSADYPLTPPQPDEDAVYYGYTELKMDREQDLTIWVGADEDAQLWLNDSLVWRGGNVHKHWFFGEVYDPENSFARDYNFSEGKRVVHFRRGRNKLFFKLGNGLGPLFFSLVLTK